MSNRPLTTAVAIFVLLVATVVGLFVFQNHTRTTQLSLDLGLVAFQLDNQLSIPLLMALCFGAGLGSAAIPLMIRSTTLSRRARRLEQELALSGGSSGDGWR